MKAAFPGMRRDAPIDAYRPAVQRRTAHKAPPMKLSSEHEPALEALPRTHSTPRMLAERARIVPLAGHGLGVAETAARLGIWRETTGNWRRRWLNADPAASVLRRLSDAPRSGAPATFNPRAIREIVALSCADLRTLDVPVSHWSQSELVRQAVQRGIADRISHGSIGCFLKRGGL